MKKLKISHFFKKKELDPEVVRTQEFLDMIGPSHIRFYTDYYICGNTYRSVWAVREYPTSTDEQALLDYLGEKENVTLKIYTRLVTPVEEKRIITNASNKNKMRTTSSTQVQDTIEAQADSQDLTVMIANMHRTREPLVHCAVFIEMIASNYEELKTLQNDVLANLIRSKINVDKLLLQQKEGFISLNPSGSNQFKEQFERVLPA